MFQPEHAISTPQPMIGFDVRQTVDQLNLFGLTIARDGTMTYANPYTFRVTAWTPNELIGQNFFDQLIPKPDEPTVRRDLDEAMQRGGL